MLITVCTRAISLSCKFLSTTSDSTHNYPKPCIRRISVSGGRQIITAPYQLFHIYCSPPTQGPTPPNWPSSADGTVIEETPSRGAADEPLPQAAPRCMTMQSEVDTPLAGSQPEARISTRGGRPRRVVVHGEIACYAALCGLIRTRVLSTPAVCTQTMIDVPRAARQSVQNPP